MAALLSKAKLSWLQKGQRRSQTLFVNGTNTNTNTTKDTFLLLKTVRFFKTYCVTYS